MSDENKTCIGDTELQAPTEAANNCTSTAENNYNDSNETKQIPPQNKEEVLQRLEEIIQNNGDIRRQDLETLKQLYFRFQTAETQAACDKFVAEGGTLEDFQPEPDPQEEVLNERYERIKAIRAENAEKEKEELQAHLQRKLQIIDLIKEASVSADAADKSFNQVRELQEEWRNIGAVPPENYTEISKNYQFACEQFYDQLQLNREARQYDFKKNLEAKTHLCEVAEQLAQEEDVISAFHNLQKLHHEFRQIGPVEKELRDEIWTRFKNASTTVNKRHQDHFAQIKAQEEENLTKKQALCEKVESIDYAQLTQNAQWEKLTKEIIALQEEWRTIGFTPKKDNAKIFERWRMACDHFFTMKSAYYKNQHQEQNANLEQKKQLAEQAEALQDSTDWNATADRLIELQRQWKKIGPVPFKMSDEIWQRFNGACNHFFKQRTQANSGQREQEVQNLEKKQHIIEQLQQLFEEAPENLRQLTFDLQEEWKSIGHVPFKKKDEIFKQYREICDQIFDHLHASHRRRNIDNFKKKVSEKAGDEISREKNKLRNLLDAKMAEIKNYETNLTFFNAKSNKGNHLVAELEHKIERLKGDLKEIKEKIRTLSEAEKTPTTPEAKED